jgi:hypothetical protein
MSGPQVYRVTAVLDEPVDADHPIHLDGLLASVWARRHGIESYPEVAAARDVHRRGDPNRVQHAHIPVHLVQARGVAVRVCSAWFWMGDAAQVPAWFTRRRDPDDVEALQAPFTPGAGPFRDVMQRRVRRAVGSVSWLGCGPPTQRGARVEPAREQVERDLPMLDSIGSVRRQGAGRVASWEVERVPDASPLACWVDAEGRAIRYLPVEWCTHTDGPVVRGAVRAPYFMRDAQRSVVEIGARVQLHADVLAELERVCGS